MNSIFTLMKLFISSIIVCCVSMAHGQSVVGKWKTVDDESGKVRSIVEISERGGLFYGKIVKLFRAPEEDQDPVCIKCEGAKKDQKVIGMEIITAMKYHKKDKEYRSGEILDPETGNVYDCKLWLDDEGNLKVRGYLLFFYRTQTWLPYQD